MQDKKLLKVDDLTVEFKSELGWNTVIEGIKFNIGTNEILGVVGESGSGKSITSLSILGLLPDRISRIKNGNILFDGLDLMQMSSQQLRTIRGNSISMIFQEPMSSLNPSMRCGHQVLEILNNHKRKDTFVSKEDVIELFDKVKLPDSKRAFKAYPHELSGGQKQRIMIAMAIACKPKLLIADEPTTALDVTVQKEIIQLLKDLQKEEGMSIIFISHDLALVSEIADRILVMYKGEIVEQGDVVSIFNSPKETYTKALIGARPSSKFRLKTLPTISDFIEDAIDNSIITTEQRKKNQNSLYSNPPLLEVKNLKKEYLTSLGLFRGTQSFMAVDDVSFKVYEGETLGLVGESGCGKSTLSNAILQLDRASSGQLFFKGKDITSISKEELRLLRKDIQIIFQDPFASLNPRITVGNAILEPMKVHNIGNSKADRLDRAKELLAKVGLDTDYMNRYPHEFSGGQRQRIGIARAIAVNPKLIICDESVSALDISVQAQVLNLLNDLKRNFGFTYIFISHDLAVVKYMSDQLLVMNKGKIEEIGDADAIYENPKKEYTKKLIHAIPKGL